MPVTIALGNNGRFNFCHEDPTAIVCTYESLRRELCVSGAIVIGGMPNVPSPCVKVVWAVLGRCGDDKTFGCSGAVEDNYDENTFVHSEQYLRRAQFYPEYHG